MKKFYITFLIFGFLLTYKNLSAEGLNSVFSRDGVFVFAVGNNGNIIGSYDGGITWSDHSFGTVNYNCVSGYNQYLYIVGDSGVLLSSNDNGGTFNQTTLAGGVNLNSVYFYNPLIGWIAGANGIILYTSNAGVNWTLQTTPATRKLNSIRFYDSQMGVAGGDAGTILTTTDGGNSWQSKSVTLSQNVLSADIYPSIVLASLQGGIVLRSTNMGNYWNYVDFKISTKSDVNYILATGPLSFISCGEGGFIRKSTDGGTTFKFLPSPLFPDLNKMYFRGSSGWAVSKNSNVVLWTTNNGDNWYLPNGVVQNFSWSLKLSTIYYTSSGNVFCLSPFNRNEIFIANQNKIYRSLNRGESFSQFSTLPVIGGYIAATNSLLMSPKDSNTLLVAIDSNYDNGKVLRTTNYGINWIVTKHAYRVADGIPLAMDPNHTDTIYYGTTDSAIFRSTNFGLTWAPAGPKLFAYNCSMKVLEGNSNIIFCGAAEDTSVGQSYLYKSTNYGFSWIVIDSNSAPGYPELPAIVNSIWNPNTLYASFFQGSNGGLKRSTNQGNFWNYINIDNNVWGIDIAKDDPNVICYGDGMNATNNITYYSLDGGIHFSDLPPLNSPNFAVFFYNRNTIFMQQSFGFYKLNVSYSNPIGIKPISSEIPKTFYLHQNYPNPFNPFTKIKFDIPKSALTSIEIYDALGRRIETPLNQQLSPGTYAIDWKGSNFASGIYFYTMSAGNYRETKRMVMVK